MELKINDVSKLTGVTVRALHYYDEIGLLKPNGITAAGYRLYNNEALDALQQILFFRELGFPLDDIKEMMANPHYNRMEALTKQKEMLLRKRNHLDDLINLVDKTLKGESDMSFKQFDTTEMDAIKKKYAAEVKARWGDTAAYAESEEKTSRYDDSKWDSLTGEGQAIIQAFSDRRDLEPDRNEVQALVKKWQDYITAHFYNCTKEILSCLGLMYTSDERFTQSIDKHGQGTAAFMAAAIKIYCGIKA